MKYAIRHVGSSDFLSGFADNGEPQWVAGWDNADMLVWPTHEQCTSALHLVTAEGLHSLIEEITK
tara:strand:- start:249 stop:443 length:195 start_codon:yes stop_codon:yes gene_type:complete